MHPRPHTAHMRSKYLFSDATSGLLTYCLIMVGSEATKKHYVTGSTKLFTAVMHFDLLPVRRLPFLTS